MTVMELIEQLKQFGLGTEVMVYDNEWGDYNSILAVMKRHPDILAHKDDPKNPSYTYPSDSHNRLMYIKHGEKDIVELVWTLSREVHNESL